jgi:hypothetical protein
LNDPSKFNGLRLQRYHFISMIVDEFIEWRIQHSLVQIRNMKACVGHEITPVTRPTAMDLNPGLAALRRDP